MLTGPFCSACGQRDIPPYPTVRELVVDAFWELSGWDGRFAATVRTLVACPGVLTKDFLEGRRARFISPLRLYLMASLVYFLVSSFVNSVVSPGAVEVPGLTVQMTATDSAALTPAQRSTAARVGAAAQSAMRDQKAVSPEQRDSLMRQIDRAPRLIRPLFRRSVLDPTGFKRGMLEAMPRVLFVLVPVFAAIVAMFYRHRKYPEHLYFAIHLHAFIFVVLTVSSIAKLARVAAIATTIKLLAVAAIPVYATMAFRRLYAGGFASTIAKEVAIGLLYSLAGGLAFLIAILVVSYGA